MSDLKNTNTHEWSDLHAEIQDWLAGYADGELDEHHTALVEAHLAGCKTCQHDVERQRILSERLQMIPTPGLSADFDGRLDIALANAPAGGKRPSGRRRMTNLKRWLSSLRPSVVIGSGGWAVALVLAAVLLMPSVTPDNINRIPMVSDVLNDYQRVALEELPTQAGNSEVSPPLPWANSRVLATWMTRVGGEPAQAYAIRQDNSLVSRLGNPFIYYQ